MTSRATRINGIRLFGYICLGIWPAFLFGAFMGFDAPNSEHALGPWLLIGFVLLMPALIFVFPRLAKLDLAAGRTQMAYVLSRSEERCVGRECVSTCRSRWARSN